MGASSFERLSRGVQAEHLADMIANFRRVEPSIDTVDSLLREFCGSDPAFEGDPYRPVLLYSDLQSDCGIRLSMGGLPYGVFFPDRALFASMQRSEGGERFLDLSMVEGDNLDESSSDAVAEFKDRSLILGNESLWDLLWRESFDLVQGDAALVLLGGNRFAVLTLDSFLQRPEAKACWITATLELERAAGRLCKRRPREALGALSEERLNGVKERFATRLERVIGDQKLAWLMRQMNRADLDTYLGHAGHFTACEPLFLDHTMFSDKKTMLLKGGFEFAISKSQLKQTFESAESLRNWCAHPSTEPELRIDSLGTLRTLILGVQQVTNELSTLAGAALT